MKNYFNFPRQLSRESYESTAKIATETLIKISGVHAIYLLGDTWQPGISDMDLLVVCPNKIVLPSPWRLGGEAQFIFTHRYLAMSEVATKTFFCLFPKETTDLRLIAGEDIGAEDPHEILSAQGYKELISCIFFDVLITKLLPLLGALRYGQFVDVRSRIGAVYSLRYSETLLNILCGYEMSPSLRGRIVSLRNEWFDRDEAANLKLLEEVSAECVDLIADMTQRFASYAREVYGGRAVQFRNRRYTLLFGSRWSKERFLSIYKWRHIKIFLFGHRFEHDTLFMPRELGIYLAWYMGGEGAFSRRVRSVSRVLTQMVIPEGARAHLEALNTAFADYEASHGAHKIPYTFGFSPDPRPLWRAVSSKLKHMLLPPPAEPIKTPVVIPLSQFATFEEYLKALSANKRSEYRRAMQQNERAWRQVQFDKEEVKKYMDLWSRQLVYGKPIHWKFGIEQVERWEREGRLFVFKADEVCLQFAVKVQGGLECHPAMYDKSAHTRIAKFMFFKLIEYMIERHLGDLDLGFISSAEEGTQYKQNYLPGHRTQI